MGSETGSLVAVRAKGTALEEIMHPGDNASVIDSRPAGTGAWERTAVACSRIRDVS